jgi:hypothetical protein
VQRRDFMSGVAAVAASRWNAEGYDIENVDEWDPVDGGAYQTGTFTPEYLIASGHDGDRAEWLFERGDFPDETIEVHYDKSGVSIALEGAGESHRAGSLANLTPEQARQLGAALYQAGEELERRKSADHAEDSSNPERT